jgi:hypothetical protein
MKLTNDSISKYFFLFIGLLFTNNNYLLGQNSPAADGYRSFASQGTYLGGGWRTVAFDPPELNIAGATPGQAWRTGLYKIDGNLLVTNSGGIADASADLGIWVNGVFREGSETRIAQGKSETLPYSFNTMLNVGDTVELKLFSPQNLYVSGGGFCDLNMTSYNLIPEPTTVLLLTIGSVMLLAYISLRQKLV